MLNQSAGSRRLRLLISLLVVFCGGCTALGGACPLRASGYIAGAAVDTRSPRQNLARVVGDAVKPFGFVYVGNTHDNIKWFSLGTAFSQERVVVFFNSSTGWISVKDYNHGVASDLDNKILAAIKAEVSRNYHGQIQFRFQHDCLG